MSKHITDGMALASLAVQLGVDYDQVRNKSRDCHDNINEAAHTVLCVWREEGIKQQKSEAAMKETLRNALHSEGVDNKDVAAKLKHHFQ